MPPTIDLRLFATLRRFAPERPEAFPIQEGATVRDVLRQLDLPEDKARLIFVNGLKVSLDTLLHAGDRLGIFPPVGGG